MPAADGEKIMHVSFAIGGGSILMGSDTVNGLVRSHRHVWHSLISRSLPINAESEAEADKLFNGLSVKTGKVIDADEEDLLGRLPFGMFTDKFGISWMVNYDYKQGGAAA